MEWTTVAAHGVATAALSLAWKAAITAAVVIGVALLAERANAVLAAVLMGLPISIGPALALLATTHGEPFVIESARYALASVFGVLAFLVTYVHAARFTGLWGCLIAGYSAWLSATLAVGHLSLSIPGALGIAVAGLLLTRLTMPRQAPPALSSDPHPLRFIIVRGVLAGLAVATVVTAGRALGPALAGLFASFPVIFGTAAWMLATLGNNDLATATLSHADRGMASFISFCFCFAVLAPVVSVWPALGISLLISVLVSVGLVMRLKHTSANGSPKT